MQSYDDSIKRAAESMPVRGLSSTKALLEAARKAIRSVLGWPITKKFLDDVVRAYNRYLSKLGRASDADPYDCRDIGPRHFGSTSMSCGRLTPVTHH